MSIAENKVPDHPTQVFLLIENRLLRETLVRLFRKRPDVCVVGHSSPTEAIGLPTPVCNVLVLDDVQTAWLLSTNMGSVTRDKGTLAMVVIGMEDEERQFIEAVKCGISGYVLNDASASDVI